MAEKMKCPFCGWKTEEIEIDKQLVELLNKSNKKGLLYEIANRIPGGTGAKSVWLRDIFPLTDNTKVRYCERCGAILIKPSLSL